MRGWQVTGESAVLEHCLWWVFVHFNIHVMVHGCARALACRAREPWRPRYPKRKGGGGTKETRANHLAEVVRSKPCMHI